MTHFTKYEETENIHNYKTFRLLSPISKALSAKDSILFCSECIEMIGGIGQLENSGVPVNLRDAQVLSIWEGTTIVQALDLKRSEVKQIFEEQKGSKKDKIEQIVLNTVNEQNLIDLM